MLEVIIWESIFYAIPVVLIVLFGISLYRYIYAKKQNKKAPGTFSPEEIKTRKIFLIVCSVIVVALLAVVIGFVVLLSRAVAYM